MKKAVCVLVLSSDPLTFNLGDIVFVGKNPRVPRTIKSIGVFPNRNVVILFEEIDERGFGKNIISEIPWNLCIIDYERQDIFLQKEGA